ncbi:MAG: extracellular solute-binding protein, partial [Deltaproteobacteria bacterium]|nr:extracellular solute-binding protein [Deltaproteobacteria bacterium]
QYSSGYIDGKMWAFPYEVVVHLWTYDARMFREAGVEPPKKDWTWLDLIDLGTKMTRDKSGKHPNEEGFDVNDVDCWGIGPWYYFLGNEHYYRIAGGEYLSPDMKRITINTEPFYEVFAFFREIFRERQIGVKTRPEKGLQTGKIALYETGNWALIGLERDVPELMAVYPPTHPETNILSTPLPQKELWIPKQKDPEIADAAYRFGKWWSLEMYVDFAVLTGYIPYLKRDLEDIRWKNLIADKPFMQVAQELVPHGRARFYTLFPLAAEAVPIMTELWDAIEATDTPPEQLLSKAEAECQRILEKGLQKYPNWISPYF